MMNSHCNDTDRMPKDLSPGDFPQPLDWSPEHQEASLTKLRDYAVIDCTKAINWYQGKKDKKKLLGTWLRFCAVLLAGLAGLIPILSGLLPPIAAELFPGRFNQDHPLVIPQTWTTLMLALAALSVAIDRFGGWTSGWVRYVTTSQELSRLQCRFQFEWEEGVHERQQEGASYEQVKQAIAKCREFLQTKHQLIEKETERWASDFQQQLNDIDGIDPRR